jgi:hypothetical protein
MSDDTLGKKIIAFAKAHLNKKVGDGECYALADNALLKAGAKSAPAYGEITDDADYVWGDPVDLNDVLPGDILQFQDFDIDTKTTTTSKLPDGKWEEKEYVAKRGHHTAIVEQNMGNGSVIILEQHVKPLGPVVQRHTIPISGPTVVHTENKISYTDVNVTVSGTIRAYRPKK